GEGVLGEPAGRRGAGRVAGLAPVPHEDLLVDLLRVVGVPAVVPGVEHDHLALDRGALRGRRRRLGGGRLVVPAPGRPARGEHDEAQHHDDRTNAPHAPPPPTTARTPGRVCTQSPRSNERRGTRWPVARLSRTGQEFCCAIWIRLPQVSSNTAVVTGPMSTGSWVKCTPRARRRS